MRSLLLPILATTLSFVMRAQVPSCNALPISYDPAGITFGEGTGSFGDSVITIPVTNTSAVGMAYPQLKLVPLTPLPSGMVMNTHWSVFASSWNPGQTMPASIFFDVTIPIPLDYSVTFEPWAYNLTPLLVDDSCVFDAPFTIDLNPSATGISSLDRGHGMSIWPVPALDRLHVVLPAGLSPERLVILNTTGMELRTHVLEFSSGEAVIDLRGLVSGTYVLAVLGDNEAILHHRFTIAH